VDHPADRDQPSSNAASWAAIVALLALIALLQWREPLAIEPRGLHAIAIASAALSGAALFYGRVRVQPGFPQTCVALMQVLLFSVLGSILSYLLAREGGALWDATFSAWDRALGYDWLEYVRLVDNHAWLALLFRASYASLIPQIIVLVLALGFTLRLHLLRSTMFAAILCGTVTVLLSPLFPAVSNFVYLGLNAGDFQHVNPYAGYIHLADYTALRDGSIGVLNLSTMQGIITFPSYHAGLATVTLWAFWRCGLAWLRWPGAAVAVCTILATPVDGGHYAVDVLAGIVLGAASIAIAPLAVSWQPTADWLRSSPFRRLRAAFAR
jgi:membrane-associated phospholipid phosphatase